MDERRSFKRLPAEAEVKVHRRDGDTVEKAAGKDLSGGGIQFSFAERLEVGSLVDIEVIQPGESRRLSPLKALIRVVRVEGEQPPFQVAGEFIEVS